MAKWSEIKGYEKGEPFFEDCTYVDVRTILNREVSVLDIKAFENDKGPGVAAKIDVGEDECVYICTHSIGIVKTLTSDDFANALSDALASGSTIDITIREGKSTKTGKYFYYVE